MKKFFLLLFIVCSMSVTAQLKILTSGVVQIPNGISGNLRIAPTASSGSLLVDYSGYSGGLAIYPSYPISGMIGKSTNMFLYGYFKYLYVNGNLVVASDEKLKKNKKPLVDPLNKVLKVASYKYDLQIGENSNIDTSQIGFIAQELMSVMPELVFFDTSNNQYGINYIGMIPYLVDAIKAQQKEINKLKENIKNNKSTELTKPSNLSEAYLSQNMPNPFSENTTIEFYLPSVVQKANFYIYDLQGKQIKNYCLSQRDYSSITIFGSELSPGIYNYSIIADGIVIGTEKMILTD